MASSGFTGSFALTAETIDEEVARTAPGVFALGTIKDDGFCIEYIARSDTDVNKKLHHHVGNYPRFKFDYFESAQAAFRKECDLWHDFSPSHNKAHPAPPSGARWTCPRCDALDQTDHRST
jgi:hypothetical protein